MLGPITLLDALLLLIALVSGMLAMYRGLTREVLAILSWVIAAVAALAFVIYFNHVAFELAARLAIDPKISLGLCTVALFLVVLVLVHVITSHFSENVLNSQIGALDRTLGFIFGVLRGFLLVVVVYFFFANLFYPNRESHFEWVKQAKSLPFIISTERLIFSTMDKIMPDKIKFDRFNLEKE